MRKHPHRYDCRGSEVIATSVERSGPGDWGVQQERVGEDRLVEVAGLVADDLFLAGSHARSYRCGGDTRRRRPGRIPKSAAPAKEARKGVGFLEVVALVQNSAPRIESSLL